MRSASSTGALTITATRVTNGGNAQIQEEFSSRERYLLEPRKRLNPSASAPASIAAQASSRLVTPQILTRVRDRSGDDAAAGSPGIEASLLPFMEHTSADGFEGPMMRDQMIVPIASFKEETEEPVDQ